MSTYPYNVNQTIHDVLGHVKLRSLHCCGSDFRLKKEICKANPYNLEQSSFAYPPDLSYQP